MAEARRPPRARELARSRCTPVSQRPAPAPRHDRLGALHAITILRADASFFFARGYLESDKDSALREEGEALIRELRDSAVGLVDAFGIPDACLAAPIAFMDPAHPTW